MRTFILRGPEQVDRACTYIQQKHDVLMQVRVSPYKENRNLDQNGRFHACCEDLARSGIKWAGKSRTPLEWKVLLISGHSVATKGAAEIVPGLENEFVNIRESSARMSVERMSSLIEYTQAFCAANGVKLYETRELG